MEKAERPAAHYGARHAPPVTLRKLRRRRVGEAHRCPLTAERSLGQCASEGAYTRIGHTVLDDGTSECLHQCRWCSALALSDELGLADEPSALGKEPT